MRAASRGMHHAAFQFINDEQRPDSIGALFISSLGIRWRL